MKTLTLTLSLLLPATASAQAASFTYIDQKVPYQNFSPPRLTALNLPKIGTTFRVQVPGTWFRGRPLLGASYALGIGVRNPGLNMPLLKGYLYTSAEIIVWSPFVGNSFQFLTHSLPIPNDTRLLGGRVYMQVYGKGINGTSVGLSRGGVATIGK